jgi:Gas vesicle protein G
MFILDTLLFGGLRFVLDRIVAAADAELHDTTPLRERLLEAQMRLELGEIDEAQFRTIERDVMARLREMNAGRDGGLTRSANQRIAVEIETFAESDTEKATRRN